MIRPGPNGRFNIIISLLVHTRTLKGPEVNMHISNAGIHMLPKDSLKSGILPVMMSPDLLV